MAETVRSRQSARMPAPAAPLVVPAEEAERVPV